MVGFAFGRTTRNEIFVLGQFSSKTKSWRKHFIRYAEMYDRFETVVLIEGPSHCPPEFLPMDVNDDQTFVEKYKPFLLQMLTSPVPNVFGKGPLILPPARVWTWDKKSQCV